MKHGGGRNSYGRSNGSEAVTSYMERHNSRWGGYLIAGKEQVKAKR